jgi:LysR family cys regulon transcriptional activator
VNFQQLRSVREAVRRGYNLTEAANALFTSQPGVSRQIRELEEELEIEIFERNGKRLVGLTEPGKGMLPIIERLLLEAENLKRAGHEYAHETHGTLAVATTHTQARYALPAAVQAFRSAYPQVRIALQQSSPEHIAQWVISGKADIGIATEGIADFEELVSLPCYEWSHSIVVPPSHPLSSLPEVSLADLSRYPLITYDVGFTGRGHIDAAFAKAGIATDIVLTAMDSDVIQQYVALGMGVGLVASMAMERVNAHQLHAISGAHLFQPNVTRLAVRRGAYLRSYAYDFISRIAPRLSRDEIRETLSQGK